MDPVAETKQNAGNPAGGAIGSSTPEKNGAAEGEHESNSKGWDAAKHWRGEAEKYRKQVADFETQAKATDEKSKAEQGKFQELYEKQKTETSDLSVRLTATLKQVAVQAEGVKLGVIDPDTLRLIDGNELQMDGEKVKNAAEAVAALAKAKPHLFGKKPNDTPTPGSVTPGSANAGSPDLGKTYTADELRKMTNPEFVKYMKQRDSARRDPFSR